MKKRKMMVNEWQEEWVGMPEFSQKDMSPYKTIKVHFRNQEDFDEFQKVVCQKVNGYNLIWFPEAKPRRVSHMRYVANES